MLFLSDKVNFLYNFGLFTEEKKGKLEAYSLSFYRDVSFSVFVHALTLGLVLGFSGFFKTKNLNIGQIYCKIKFKIIIN